MNQIEQLQGRLPANPGIHAKEEYINTAVLVLLVFIGGEYHFVFQKRGPKIRQNGEICFPGGVYNPEDGTPEQTAVRETVEEMGIPAEKIVDEEAGKEVVLFPARELGLPERYAKPWGNIRHNVYVYKVEQGLIWGITARFIVDVVGKLKSGAERGGNGFR